MSALQRPAVTVEVDFVNDPTSLIETWTDVTPYCRVQGLDTTVFTTSRGRDQELSRVATGTYAIAWNNNDGRFDPNNLSSPYVTGAGNPGGAPGLVTAMRRIRIRATWLTITYGVLRGYIEEFPQVWTDAAYGQVNTTGRDGFAPLAQITLQALSVVEPLKDNPIGFYRLNDPVGSVMAGNTSTYNQPLTQIVAGSTAAVADTFAFGVAAGTDNLLSDQSTALHFMPTWNGSLNASGYCLRTADKGVGPLLQIAAGFTVGVWFNSTETTKNFLSELFWQSEYSGTAQVEMYLFPVTIAGQPTYTATFSVAGSNATIALVTGTANVTDGKWHYIAGKLGTDLKTVTLWIDGVSQGTSASGTAMTWNAPYLSNVGGTVRPNFKGGNDFLNGSVKNLGLFLSPLSTARILAHFKAGTSFANEQTGSRIGRLLDAAAWPAALRSLATGDTTVGSQVTEGLNALEAIQAVGVDSERGVVFIDGNGQVAFTNRGARYNGAPVAVFGDGVGEFHYEGDISPLLEPRDIYNDIAVSRQNGISVRNISTASERRYFPKTLQATTFASSDADAVYLAQYLASRYSDPQMRIPTLKLHPSADISLFPQVLGREIGDRITVKRRPMGAPIIQADFFIEKISHAVTPAEWWTTWQLSPAVSDTYFQLNSSTLGRLGGGSTLNAAMTAGQTTLVTPDSVFNASDVPYTVQVDSEQMTVTAATAPGAAPQTLTVTRAVNSTTAAVHSSAAAVTLVGAQRLAY
jgi:hypothetical protein